MVSAVRKWSEEVDYQGLAMRYQAEEFVFFVCFGSLISHLIHFVLCKHASGLSLQDGTKMELVCKDDLSPGSLQLRENITLWPCGGFNFMVSEAESGERRSACLARPFELTTLTHCELRLYGAS